MKDLWDSKKFKAALLAGVVAAIASYFEVSAETVWAIIAPLLFYIGAQGAADFGKAAK